MIQRRNQKIHEMHSKGISLADISVKFKISPERVRQIVSFEPNFCLKHSKYFKTTCPYCEIGFIYEQMYSGYSLSQIIELGEELSKLSRNKEDVLKKRIFVKLMRDKFKYSFARIAKVLKKDHTSIINLYTN